MQGCRGGHGGRIEVRPDLTVEGFPGVYVLGDFGIPARMARFRNWVRLRNRAGIGLRRISWPRSRVRRGLSSNIMTRELWR